MKITIRAGTQAASCNEHGTFDSNIRPNIYSCEQEAEVVKSGYTPAKGYSKGYMWYVVRYWGGYSFVTSRDIIT